MNLTSVGVNLTTIADQHSSPGTKLSRHTYQTKHTDRCWTYVKTVTDQHSSQSTNLADTPTKLNAPTNVELNDCNWPTFLLRYQLSWHTYQTKCTNRCERNDCRWSTFLPILNSADTPTKLNAPTGVNVTTVTDQHSSQGTKLSRHTYQTKRTNRCELNDCSQSISSQEIHLPN